MHHVVKQSHKLDTFFEVEEKRLKTIQYTNTVAYRMEYFNLE